MSDNEAVTEEKKGKKSLLIIVMAVVLGVGAGGGGGILAAKTVLAGTSALAGEPAAEPKTKSSSKDKGHADSSASLPMYLIENVVLNPAESRGTRYLMVSVAFAVGDETVSESMTSREVEVRDALMSVLGSKTVSELSDIAQRDTLKVQVIDGVRKLFPTEDIQHVYFPQFVIQ